MFLQQETTFQTELYSLPPALGASRVRGTVMQQAGSLRIPNLAPACPPEGERPAREWWGWDFHALAASMGMGEVLHLTWRFQKLHLLPHRWTETRPNVRT